MRVDWHELCGVDPELVGPSSKTSGELVTWRFIIMKFVMGLKDLGKDNFRDLGHGWARHTKLSKARGNTTRV